jgi:hypothetical protein
MNHGKAAFQKWCQDSSELECNRAASVDWKLFSPKVFLMFSLPKNQLSLMTSKPVQVPPAQHRLFSG